MRPFGPGFLLCFLAVFTAAQAAWPMAGPAVRSAYCRSTRAALRLVAPPFTVFEPIPGDVRGSEPDISIRLRTPQGVPPVERRVSSRRTIYTPAALLIALTLASAASRRLDIRRAASRLIVGLLILHGVLLIRWILVAVQHDMAFDTDAAERAAWGDLLATVNAAQQRQSVRMGVPVCIWLALHSFGERRPTHAAPRHSSSGD